MNSMFFFYIVVPLTDKSTARRFHKYISDNPGKWPLPVGRRFRHRHTHSVYSYTQPLHSSDWGRRPPLPLYSASSFGCGCLYSLLRTSPKYKIQNKTRPWYFTMCLTIYCICILEYFYHYFIITPYVLVHFGWISNWVNFKWNTVNSALFVGDWCSWILWSAFTHEFMYLQSNELSCTVMQQTSYPQNYVPTNQQNFDKPLTLAPIQSIIHL